MAKTEDIEAKLAAYVDGELPEADKAEIEKHLATHPTHRQLLEELMRQKDLLRVLPRAMAPADVADAVTAQLERAVLLGDVDGGTTGSMAIGGPWLRWRAIAAVLALTVSLAAVIAALLPSLNHPPVTLNFPNPTTAESEVALAAPTELRDETATADRGHVDAFAARLNESSPSKSPAEALATLPPAGNTVNTMQSNNSNNATRQPPILVLGNSTETMEQMYRRLLPAQPGADLASASSPFMCVITTDNPAATHQAVTSYLVSNRIPWEARSEPIPVPAPIAAQQQVYASKFQQQSVQLRRAEPAADWTASPPAEGAQQPGAAVAAAPTTIPSGELGAENRPPRGFWAGGGGGTFSAVSFTQRQRIVAKQVTLQQAADLRNALAAVQRQARSSRQQGLTISVGSSSAYPTVENFYSSNFGGVPAGAAAVPTTNTSSADARNLQRGAPPALANGQVINAGTLMLSVPEQDGNMNYAPLRLDAPAVELKNARAVPATPGVENASALGNPTTQADLAAIAQTPAAALPPAETERVDFVIVVQPPIDEAGPTTQPGTQPPLP